MVGVGGSTKLPGAILNMVMFFITMARRVEHMDVRNNPLARRAYLATRRAGYSGMYI